jgi:hypothetical protein
VAACDAAEIVRLGGSVEHRSWIGAPNSKPRFSQPLRNRLTADESLAVSRRILGSQIFKDSMGGLKKRAFQGFKGLEREPAERLHWYRAVVQPTR